MKINPVYIKIHSIITGFNDGQYSQALADLLVCSSVAPTDSCKDIDYKTRSFLMRSFTDFLDRPPVDYVYQPIVFLDILRDLSLLPVWDDSKSEKILAIHARLANWYFGSKSEVLGHA